MQQTAYEMRISDWSSDVCSSDLAIRSDVGLRHAGREHAHAAAIAGSGDSTDPFPDHRRRQLSESDDARRYSGEPLAIGVDRVGIAHHGTHFRSRTAAMISTPNRRSPPPLVIAEIGGESYRERACPYG